MTKYLILFLLFAGACSNGKIVVNDIKASQDKSVKESIFNDFLIALRDGDFSKIKPLIVQQNEYLSYLQSLTTETVDPEKLGGSVNDLYQFHISQTERSFNRLMQKAKANNINWSDAVINKVSWEKDGGGQGENAQFIVENSEGIHYTILAKGMGKVNDEWRLGNTFLIEEK